MKQLGFFIFFLFGLNGFTQQTDYVDFKSANADISFGDLTKKEVFGTVSYEFEILKDTDSIFMDAQNMDFKQVLLNGDSINWFNDGKKLWILNTFKPSKGNQLSFDYKAHPKKALYFIDWDYEDGNKQVWTQGQGKYTSNWLPSIDDMNDKIEFDVSVTFNKDYEVIANGSLISKQLNDSTITWHYNMQKPMASYLVALAIGKYNKKVAYSKSGISLEMYYYPEDSLKVEPTYRYTKQIFDFLETEIGVPYPWQNYKEVPVKDFLYAGMENTSTTIFSDAFVVDSIGYNDKNYVNVNAHEMAHQWFGDLVTETSGTHHWLQEGFATYYALLAERNIFGDDYYYWRLYEYAQELLEQDKAGQSTSLLNPKSSSVTFYKKGAWVLHMLREKVGDKPFKTAVKNYLLKHEFQNVETNDFIKEVEQASGQDLNEFVKVWLESKTFYYDKALESLKKSSFIQEYLMTDCEVISSKCKDYLISEISDKAKIKIIEQDPSSITVAAFKNSLKVRQAIAQTLTDIPLELKESYESLLDDKSYITKEIALYNLWVSFPEDRIKYLEKTKEIQGLHSKNVRMLWLALALNTPEFEPENNQIYFEELRGYTDARYDFEIRQNAFQYLNAMKACDGICKENLKQATTHHNWQFSKFAKNMLSQFQD